MALALVRVSHDAFDMDTVLTIVNPELIRVQVRWGLEALPPQSPHPSYPCLPLLDEWDLHKFSINIYTGKHQG